MLKAQTLGFTAPAPCFGRMDSRLHTSLQPAIVKTSLQHVPRLLDLDMVVVTPNKPKVRLPSAAPHIPSRPKLTPQLSSPGLTQGFTDPMAEPHWMGQVALGALGVLAKQSGLYWTNPAEIKRVAAFLQPLANALENRRIAYPAVYMQGFHGYANNLTWKSVLEQETAMQLLPALALGKPGALGPAIRRQVLEAAIEQIKLQQGAAAKAVRRIVDIGTGVGTTARMLARHYDKAKVTGVDLSAPMLAAAQAITEPLGERVFSPQVITQLRLGDNPADLEPRLSWHHARGEATGLRQKSADLVTFFFSAHEQQQQSLEEIAREARRLLKPGGVFVIVDNDQNTPVLSMLRAGPKSFLRAAGAAVFEPNLEEYYRCDIPAAMRRAGYEVVRALNVPTCTAILGVAS